MEKSLRSVSREPRFEEELRALVANAAEADVFTQAADWVLSQSPDLGELAEAGPPEVWIMPMFPVKNLDIWLYYTFDETTWFLSSRAF